MPRKFTEQTEPIPIITLGLGANGDGILTPAGSGRVAITGNLGFSGSDIPGSAPTVAINASAGNLTGAYRYRVTFVTAKGETDPGIYSNSVSPAAQQVDVTDIPVGGSSVTSRKIYRQIADAGIGSNLYYLLTTINDNVTTSYTDNIPDGSLGAIYPGINTTAGMLYVNDDPLLRYGSVSTYLGLNSGVNGTGYANTGYGAYSLTANTTGEYNTAIGRDSLRSTTTGSNNTALGTSSLFSNATGLSNTAVGVSALYSNLGGGLNTAVGRTAAYSNASGSNNTNVGNGASFRNVTGSSNTVIGVNAGYGAAGGSNISNNVLIGKEAGAALATGGDSNVFVGTQTGDTVTTGSQNILIGHNLDAPSNTASGQISIGNLIFGIGATGTGTTISTGSVGIGIAPSTTTMLLLPAGTTGVSSIRLPHGSAPTSPVDGDMWTTTAGLFVRINGATVGPLAA